MRYIKPQPEPATKEELAAYTRERKFQRAVDLRLPFKAEEKLRDPALRGRLRPVYDLPQCPECKRTVRHYGWCKSKTVSLKPTVRWERKALDDRQARGVESPRRKTHQEG
jgi:hypothetical protein